MAVIPLRMVQGMLQSAALRDFYKDLTNEAFQTGLVVYHRRYSTNTSPRWPLAQPMRVLGHNGESSAEPLPGNSLKGCFAPSRPWEVPHDSLQHD